MNNPVLHKLNNLIGGEPTIPLSHKVLPEDAAEQLSKILKQIPKDDLEKEIGNTRNEVAGELIINEE